MSSGRRKKQDDTVASVLGVILLIIVCIFSKKVRSWFLWFFLIAIGIAGIAALITAVVVEVQTRKYIRERNVDVEDMDLLSGHDFEYWCADLLRKNGFYGINVTRGSGDQGVDIIARKRFVKYAIQCKCYSKNLGNTPVQEVAAGKVHYRCQVAVVMTNRYFTKSAIELAKSNGVKLWDRNKLLSMDKK